MEMRKLLIAAIPAGDDSVASARIRAHSLLRCLPLNGAEVAKNWRQADVLFVQKRITWRILWRMRLMRWAGRLVIYDIDDSGPALSFWAPGVLFSQALACANLVTTDTEGRMERIRSAGCTTPIAVLPDAIDYYPEGPVRCREPISSRLRVLWFGSFSNISLFERYVGTLIAMPGVQVVVITNPDSGAELHRRYPDIEICSWSQSSFVADLQGCHLSCLMHDGSADDRVKSNNRMITSVTWGVPSLVSDTPEYRRTAEDCGVPEAVFADPDGLRRAVETHRTTLSRIAYLDRAQRIVWKNFAPGAVTSSFLGLVTQMAPVVSGGPMQFLARVLLASRLIP